MVADRLETEDDALPREWASAKDFLTHVTGGRKGAGAALVRTATKTRELPEIREALREGTISLSQASVIGARVATLPHHEQLRGRAAGKMLALAGLHHERFLSFAPDAVGGVRIKGYGTPEEAEIIKTALLPLAAPVTTEPGDCGGRQRTGILDPDGVYRPTACPDPECGHDGRDPREHGARMWDALLEACTRLQATDQLPHSHGATARLAITMPFTDLAEGIAATGLLESGDSLSAQAVRRLAGDAEVIPTVLGATGQVLDVGRTSRLVTAAIWAALVVRDQHCTFPGCTRRPHACDAHHIEHWADGGVTALENLALLCRRHHTLAHHTAWTIYLDPDTRRPKWRPPPDYYADIRDRMSVHVPGMPGRSSPAA